MDSQRLLTCNNCHMRYHPAINVLYKHLYFCSFKCKEDWLDDNMIRQEHPAEQLQLHFMGDYNETT